MASTRRNQVSEDGLIERRNGEVIVRLRSDKEDGPGGGATCSNAEAPVAKRVWEKRFAKKQIFLPDEFAAATTFLRSVPDVITLGATGYSSLKPDVCAAWGIKPGAYEAACAALLAQTVRYLQIKFEGVRIKLTHGASDMGIDRVVIDVARQLNLDQLGFNCPRWMSYVNDDEVPVYVAKSQSDYSDAFVRSTDILLSVGGRQQSLIHDITGAIKYGKRLIVCPIMVAISSNGGPPSRNAEGGVEDATQALLTSLSMPNLAGNCEQVHDFDGLTRYVGTSAAEFAQNHLLSPARAYPWVPPNHVGK